MIESLEGAWKWYQAVRTLALDMRRLAAKWNEPALWDTLGRDNRFQDLSAADLKDRAETVLEDLNPLAVLVLFSVFEVTVRDRVKADVDRETETIQHPALARAVRNLKEDIENGSFGRVIESYKSMDVDLTAQVNQVRKFRNWVAHGRRGKRPENSVQPESAMERLRGYLAKLEEIEQSRAIVLPPDAPVPVAPPDPPPEPPDQPTSGG
jgi:hypothetical protein